MYEFKSSDVFDFANFIQCNQDTKEAYEMLKPYISYIHVKDARREDGEVVLPGEGDGQLADIFTYLDNDQFDGYLSLEPHLFHFKGLDDLENLTDLSLFSNQISEVKNLEVCPSNINLAGAEVQLVSAKEREYKLKDKLDKYKDNYDYIIIDCPPSLGLVTLNAFTASDSVLIPIQCEYYALEGLGQLINTINLVKKRMNKSLSIEGALLTMYDARTNLSNQVVKEVKNYFDDKVYKTVIPRNVKLSEAPSFGMPITVYAPKSKGARCYEKLTNEIIKGKK